MQILFDQDLALWSLEITKRDLFLHAPARIFHKEGIHSCVASCRSHWCFRVRVFHGTTQFVFSPHVFGQNVWYILSPFHVYSYFSLKMVYSAFSSIHARVPRSWPGVLSLVEQVRACVCFSCTVCDLTNGFYQALKQDTSCIMFDKTWRTWSLFCSCFRVETTARTCQRAGQGEAWNFYPRILFC